MIPLTLGREVPLCCSCCRAEALEASIFFHCCTIVMYVVVTRTVVVVVMLADYLPEMQRVHLITLIIMIGIVNSSARIHRQVFLSVCFNEIDRPTSRIDQGIVC